MKKGEKVKLPNREQLWNPLTKDEVDIFDNAAYNILANVGVHIDDMDCINTFKDAPVEIDEKELIIKFPEDWVKDMLKKVPKNYTFAGRVPKHDMSFTGLKDHYAGLTSEATKMFVWNEQSNAWDSIDPGIKDVIRAAKMIDAIEAYDSFYASPVGDIQSTKEGLPAELHTLYGKLVGSSKNTGGCVITEGGVPEWDYAAKIAAEVQGGLENLAKRPIFMGLPSCIGPLQCTRQNFWALVGPTKYKLPTVPYYGGTQPFTAPATLAGAMALALACNYFVMASHQYLDPGGITMPTPFSLAANPQNGQLTFGPMVSLSGAAQDQVFKEKYGFPTCQYTNTLTCSLEEQVAHMMFQYTAATISGANWLMVDPSPQAFMWETIIMCRDIIRFSKQLIYQYRDMHPTDEFLALDVMKEIGPKKHFTTHKHTLKWIDPKEGLYFKNDDWIQEHADKWRTDGAKRWLYDSAREQLKELDKYEPEPLPKDVLERMDNILAEADKELALF